MVIGYGAVPDAQGSERDRKDRGLGKFERDFPDVLKAAVTKTGLRIPKAGSARCMAAAVTVYPVAVRRIFQQEYLRSAERGLHYFNRSFERFSAVGTEFVYVSHRYLSSILYFVFPYGFPPERRREKGIREAVDFLLNFPAGSHKGKKEDSDGQHRMYVRR